MINEKLLLCALLACCFTSISMAQDAVPVKLDVVRHSIVFLYGSLPSGEVNPAQPLATGFLIGVPHKSNPKQATILLVTARHVVDPAWAGCSDQIINPKRIFMRMNKKVFDPASVQSGVDYLSLDLMLGSTVFLNPDDSVDAAVVGVTVPQKQYDEMEVESIGLSNFATPAELNQFNTGIEIISAGLFPAFPGVQRNYPVFKFGRISAKPDEKLQMPCRPGVTKPLSVWFIAINLIGGNSGSPILTVPRMFSGDRPALVGLQSMTIEGSDVSGMTPSDRIFEIIEKLNLPDGDLYRGPERKVAKP